MKLTLFSLFLAAVSLAGETNVTRSITLNECVERALAQNLDLQIERINPGIEDWSIVREQAAFEPTLTGKLSYEDTKSTTLQQQDLTAQLGLADRLPTGTELGFTVGDTRTGSNLTTNFIHTGAAVISLTQPLLKNFGYRANTALLRVARKSRQAAGQQLADQVTQIINAVHSAYYELVFAIEAHKAKVEDLNRAKALLAENRKRVEIGVLSPLDITQAEAGAAEREEAVIVAERVIRDNENALKRLISQDLLEWRRQSLVPVDYPVVEMVDLDVDRSTHTALAQRPDYRQLQYELDRQHILVAYRRNQLWPQVDLQGSFGLNGWSNTGFGDFVGNVTSGDNPAWAVGVVVTVPLGNRRERSSYQTARLQSQQALLSLKRLEQQIIAETDNAVRLVQTNLKRVDATRAASRLAEESLRAEEHKLRAGTSTSFLVLQAQAQLAAARSAEIRARADYSVSLAELARAEGTTLQKHHIVLPD